METWNVWENLHWKRVGENERLAMKKMIRLLSESPSKTKAPETKPSESRKTPSAFEIDHDIVVPKKEGQGGQWEMDF